MKRILKLLYYLYLRIVKFPVFVFNGVRFRLLAVRIGWREIYAIEGIPFIRNSGSLEIRRNVKINSRYSINPIGGQTFCSFAVWPGASLVIDEGAGISNSAIVCARSVYIGKNVIIGGDCKIYDTDFHALEFDQRSDDNRHQERRPVTIEEGVFIGGGSTILKGVTIGSYAIVGAGSVVAKSVPAGEIWAGNPAKFIKKVNQTKLSLP